MKTIKITFLIFSLFYALFPAAITSAASLRLGMPCPDGDDSACISGHCGESNVAYQGQKLWFCDCGLDLGGGGQMCLDEYGNKGEVWECKPGSSAPQQSFGLDYCQKTSTPVEPAIFPVDQKKIRAAESRLGAPVLKGPGNPCTNADECVYKKCEPSDVNGLAFCTCSGASDCETEFGPGNWACPAGTPASHNVSFCQDGTNEPHYFATAASIATAKSLTEVTAPGAASTPPKKITLTVPILNVQIPGLAKWSPQEITPGETITVPYLVDYILALYRYAIIIAAIIAVIMLMAGGLMYLISRGIPANLTKAKEVMFGAVSGLTLILASYMMLNIINPNLVQLKPIQIQSLQLSELPIDLIEEPIADVPITQGVNNVVMFKQFSSQWASSIYGYIGTACDCGTKSSPGPDSEECKKESTKCCTSIQQAGCGPTSLAMILATYGANANPKIVADFVGQKGYGRVCNKGTDIETAIQKLGKSSWSNFAGQKISKEKALELLAEKKPIIFLCKSCAGTGSNGLKNYKGHYMVLTGINASNNVTVNDPGANENIAIKIMTTSQLDNNGGFWFVYPKK